jgi:hypothetical protein
MLGPSTKCSKSKDRRGIIQLEILVSAMLLGALVSCMVGLNFRLLGVVKDTKRYQVALHEATNYVQELTSGGLEELDRRIAQVRLASDIEQVLPGGTVQVQRIEDRTGIRVLVRIVWERSGIPNSVELTGWVSTQEKSP